LILFANTNIVSTNKFGDAMDKKKKILYLISRSINTLKYYSIARFNEEGVTVTPAQMGILFLLRKGIDLPMTELSNSLSLDNSTLTRHSDKLIKSGLAERVKDDSDRRVSKLRITKSGIEESNRAIKIANEINSDVISGFSQSEIEIFTKILESINLKFDTKRRKSSE
jgi:DNA-binding MarR family transcriptional regulator